MFVMILGQLYPPVVPICTCWWFILIFCIIRASIFQEVPRSVFLVCVYTIQSYSSFPHFREIEEVHMLCCGLSNDNCVLYWQCRVCVEYARQDMEANEVSHSLCSCEHMYMKEGSKEGRPDGRKDGRTDQGRCLTVFMCDGGGDSSGPICCCRAYMVIVVYWRT
jgi:hypothetical protein